MSSAEIEVQLVEGSEAFTVKVKLNDPDMSGTALDEKAKATVATIMSAITDNKPSNI